MNDPLLIGYLGCAAMLVLLLLSMPVAFAMGIVGIVGFALIRSWQGAVFVLHSELYDVFSSYNFTVIPLFIFMGQIAFHTGISRRLFAAAYHWAGALRGGMAMATVGACAAFGAVCGSGPATAATMSAVALPEMARYRYDKALSTGVVAAAGSLGMLIPPSVVFMVYGILTEQSVGKLFMAGVLPGLLCAFVFCAIIYVQCLLRPELAPPAPKSAWRDKFVSLGGCVEMLILFVLVVGGIYRGWFTPNEGAAIGAAGAIALTLVRRECTWGMIFKAAQESLVTSCMVLFIVACAMMFSRFLAVSTIPMRLAEGLTALTLPRYVTLALILAFYLVAGCFVDSLALILLTVPILYKPIIGMGFDPIWFGVVIVLVTQMGVITPPVGINVYVVGGMDRSTPLQAIFRGAMPFLLGIAFTLLLLTLFPAIVTFLPNTLNP
ncbi:MAG: TRAP transporter large permease [Kiritimatiellaeota bacterium]|nr:TRAP transporter large permease [Kiritimatiellota bacterium]